MWIHLWWYLRNSNSSGNADYVFRWGRTTDSPFEGDWDGNGTETPGATRDDGAGNLWLLNNGFDSNSDDSFYYGVIGDIPLAGDWNGVGVDHPAIFRPSQNNLFALNYDFDDGTADKTCNYGSGGDMAVAGRRTSGIGRDGIGVYRTSNNRWYLNHDCDGASDLDFGFGVATDLHVVGNWDGLEVSPYINDGVGVVRGNDFYLDHDNNGSSDNYFVWGYDLDTPVPGDWNGTDSDTVGIVRGRVDAS